MYFMSLGLNRVLLYYFNIAHIIEHEDPGHNNSDLFSPKFVFFSDIPRMLCGHFRNSLKFNLRVYYPIFKSDVFVVSLSPKLKFLLGIAIIALLHHRQIS